MTSEQQVQASVLNPIDVEFADHELAVGLQELRSARKRIRIGLRLAGRGAQVIENLERILADVQWERSQVAEIRCRGFAQAGEVD